MLYREIQEPIRTQITSQKQPRHRYEDNYRNLPLALSVREIGLKGRLIGFCGILTGYTLPYLWA